MYNNLKRFIFLIIVTIAFSDGINAQYTKKFNVSITAGVSQTGSVKYSEQYRQFDRSPTFNILETGQSRNRNYNLSLGFQPTKSISINSSFGMASYGFRYVGDVIASPTNPLSIGGFTSRENYTVRILEFGLSATYRVVENNDIAFIVQPGIAWYTNETDSKVQIFNVGLNQNNFSGTLFTGVELPLKNNSFFISIGISSKIALKNFARDSDFDDVFRPYAIGLQTSVSYRFGAFKSK